MKYSHCWQKANSRTLDRERQTELSKRSSSRRSSSFHLLSQNSPSSRGLRFAHLGCSGKSALSSFRPLKAIRRHSEPHLSILITSKYREVLLCQVSYAARPQRADRHSPTERRTDRRAPRRTRPLRHLRWNPCSVSLNLFLFSEIAPSSRPLRFSLNTRLAKSNNRSSCGGSAGRRGVTRGYGLRAAWALRFFSAAACSLRATALASLALLALRSSSRAAPSPRSRCATSSTSLQVILYHTVSYLSRGCRALRRERHY